MMNTIRPHLAMLLSCAALGAVALLAPITLRPAAAAPAASSGTWRTDPDWYQGKAEWALYDAVRPLYGIDRHYEASIFTNKQQMDPGTTTKAADGRDQGAIEVFKHNVSEMIPSENYTYRFLTTSFVRTDTLEAYKVVCASQEDCGSSYKQVVVDEDTVRAQQFGYFPDEGHITDPYDKPSSLAFHDALTLTLRDYPFDAEDKPVTKLKLVPDQTDTHRVVQRPGEATVQYIERATIEVPYGILDTHHLRVTHDRDGGALQSDYWFAVDLAHRHVLVKYAGPYGVRYELKNLAWWKYWDRSQPRP